MSLLSRLVKKSYPLRVHISTLFLVLVLSCCGSLSLLFYSQSKEMINTEVEKRLARILREATNDLERITAPPTAVVNLLANYHIVEAADADERLETVPFLIEALNSSAELSSVYVGYPEGDFFLLRRVQTDALKEFFAAPPDISWMAQSIDHESERFSKQFIFYSDAGALVEARHWDTEFDPRTRPWYEQASAEKNEIVRSEPYIFYTDHKIGMTFSIRIPSGQAIIGADVKLETLSSMLEYHKITPHTQVVLLDKQGRLIACEDPDKLIHTTGDKVSWRRGSVSDLQSPVLDSIIRIWRDHGEQDLGQQVIKVDSESWVGTVVKLDFSIGSPVFLALALPYDELMAEVRAIMKQAVLIGLAVILAMIPLTLAISRVIARPLNRLAEDADQVRRFDFSETKAVNSYIREVDELASAMAFTKQTVSEFLELLESINREKNFDAVLNRLAEIAGEMARADGVCIYLLDVKQTVLQPSISNGRIFEAALPNVSLDTENQLTDTVSRSLVGNWKITAASSGAVEQEFYKSCGAMVVRCVPLHSRQGEISLGAICLFYRGKEEKLETAEYRDRLLFIEQFSEFTGVTLQTKQLIDQQKALFEAFIDLIIKAIDAKSPYTGEHCQRVPIIASMLAEAVCAEKDGALSDCDWSEDEWEELRVAAKLHDCGKITTPEFVVDKATKLETIYNRIHEIRMRFEVIRRDAEIDFWRRLDAGADRQQLLDELALTNRELADEFAFVASCNIGGEFLGEEMIERLRKISSRTWLRHFDDRLGLSWEERKRAERTPKPDLPVMEALLDDKEEHVITRSTADHIAADNPWGFKLDEPEHLYNRGELYNLSVKRGTLSDEERYKINDHIVQTIKMLETLPFPTHLQRVPEIAGGHHETMTGTGYPRQLEGEDMSVRARIMVIADVFEALTASGRPYKKAKKLSEALAIMGTMHKKGHFDDDLFRLFLTRGVFAEYARSYLEDEQLDEVDVNRYL